MLSKECWYIKSLHLSHYYIKVQNLESIITWLDTNIKNILFNNKVMFIELNFLII